MAKRVKYTIQTYPLDLEGVEELWGWTVYDSLGNPMQTGRMGGPRRDAKNAAELWVDNDYARFDEFEEYEYKAREP